MSSFKFFFFGWLFASHKSGFSGFRCRFIPSLRFGTGYASPYNPCHCLKLKNSYFGLIKVKKRPSWQKVTISCSWEKQKFFPWLNYTPLIYVFSLNLILLLITQKIFYCALKKFYELQIKYVRSRDTLQGFRIINAFP